jgi:hypothetical protein
MNRWEVLLATALAAIVLGMLTVIGLAANNRQKARRSQPLENIVPAPELPAVRCTTYRYPERSQWRTYIYEFDLKGHTYFLGHSSTPVHAQHCPCLSTNH